MKKSKRPTLLSLNKLRTKKMLSGDWEGALKVEKKMRKFKP